MKITDLDPLIRAIRDGVGTTAVEYPDFDKAAHDLCDAAEKLQSENIELSHQLLMALRALSQEPGEGDGDIPECLKNGADLLEKITGVRPNFDLNT